MSLERHPNINAVGFMFDIHEALKKHIRGRAKELLKNEHRETLQIAEYISVSISEHLDKYVVQKGVIHAVQKKSKRRPHK